MPESPKIKILLVDDRPENLISLGAVLDNPDYELIQAESGKEALRQLLSHEFALVLLDVHMPIMDGFETAKFIREREKSKDIPIIFLSAIIKDEPFVFRGYGAGAVDYILKPFDPMVLRSKVAVFAELHRKNLALRAQTERIVRAERIEREQQLMQMEIRHLRREQLAQQRYRDLVERIPDGVVWSAEPETFAFTFSSSNADRFLGCAPAAWETNPQFWFDIQHPEDLACVREAFLNALAVQKDFSIEHRIVRSNGEVVWLQTGVRLVTTETAEKHEFRGLSIDITKVKNSEDAARKALHARDEFLSIASHELKTPLTALKLCVQSIALLRKKGLPLEILAQRVEHGMGIAGRQVDRLCRLISELLDVSRIENGHFQLERNQVHVREILQEVVGHFAVETSTQNVSIQLKVDETMVGFWDPLRVEQVVINLLSNAIKYGKGKPIQLKAWKSKGMAHISVKDQGDGIDAADQVRIFQRFERATSERNFGGLGLGLYIAKNIVSAHGGTIDVKSEPERGATFTVSLPVEDQIGNAVEHGSIQSTTRATTYAAG